MAIHDVELSCAVCGTDLNIRKIEPAPFELVMQAWSASHSNHPPELVHDWLESVVEEQAAYRQEARAERRTAAGDDGPWSTPG